VHKAFFGLNLAFNGIVSPDLLYWAARIRNRFPIFLFVCTSRTRDRGYPDITAPPAGDRMLVRQHHPASSPNLALNDTIPMHVI
jgi:hypothetical protein